MKSIGFVLAIGLLALANICCSKETSEHIYTKSETAGLPGAAKDEATPESIVIWAFGAYRTEAISFDALWEVVRASTDKSVSDEDVFRVISAGLVGAGADDRTKTVKIVKNGAVFHAIREAKKEKYIEDGRLLLFKMCFGE